jgi:hypothetical protein
MFAFKTEGVYELIDDFHSILTAVNITGSTNTIWIAYFTNSMFD